MLISKRFQFTKPEACHIKFEPVFVELLYWLAWSPSFPGHLIFLVCLSVSLSGSQLLSHSLVVKRAYQHYVLFNRVRVFTVRDPPHSGLRYPSGASDLGKSHSRISEFFQFLGGRQCFHADNIRRRI